MRTGGNMKKIIAMLLLVACAFSTVSCAIVPAYNSDELLAILEDKGYSVTDVDVETNEGVVGYIYAVKAETGDEIYYIYCEDFASSRSLYNYIDSLQRAKIAEIKMEIEKIEYALYKAEGVTAAEKGDYYERYVMKTEELAEVERYVCARAVNVVWYGTKQAVADIKNGTD